MTISLKQYFSDDELACKGSGLVMLDPRFEAALYIYRVQVDMTLHPSSCCRSLAHNRSVGGASSSYHLFEGVNDGRMGSLAIDLKVTDSVKRAIMVSTALSLGWSVLIYDTFIHIDRRTDLGKEQICKGM